MKIIAFFFENSRRTIILSVIAGVLSGGANAALLAVINASLKTTRPARILVLEFAGLCLVLPLARFFSELLLTRLGQEAMYMLRMKLCGQILAAPLRHLEKLGSAKLLATLTEDIPNLTGALTVLPVLCINAALVVGCLAYMAVLSWLMFAVVIGFMIVGIVGYQVPIAKVQKIFINARQNSDALMNHLRALTQGAKELKSHRARRQAFIKEQLQVSARSFMDHNISALRLYSGASSWGQTLVFIVIGIYLFFLPPYTHAGTTTLIGYTLALLYLMTPLQVIMNSLPQLSRANVALNTVEELGFTLVKEKPEEFSENCLPAARWRTLALRAATHFYERENESETFVVGPIDLTFDSGEIVFITGGNGSGKTTLIKMIAGLYKPESGALVLDGQTVDDGNIEWYRQYFSIVFSDFYLFEHLLGVEGEDMDTRARGYLEELKLSQKVKVSEGKLSTIELSQGQRKRLALLAAYMEDRPIYIFDEWAADQDPYFKNIFYVHILPELKARGKTVLVVSHDDRYYSMADRAIKLENGQVVSDTAPSAVPVEVNKGQRVP